MGMFDCVHYEGKTYQTKNFDCEMRDYKIENGRLLKNIGHYIDTPKDEKPYPDAPEGSFESFFGSIKWISEGWEDMDFHGIVNCYDVLFKFTDGVLVDIKKLPTATQHSTAPD